MKPILILSLFLIVSSTIHAQSGLDSLNKLLIDAQTKNQLSQSEYYKTQSHTISNQLISVLGALGGSIIGLLGGLLIARNNKKGENEKFEKVLEEERTKNMKIAAAELMKKTAEGFHSLTWILWIAKNTPSACTVKLVDDHDKKMNRIYSEIAGAQVVLSAYSKSLYEVTVPIIKQLYKNDGNIGRIAFGLRDATTANDSISQLGNLWQGVYDYSLEIPGKFADGLKIALPNKANASH